MRERCRVLPAFAAHYLVHNLGHWASEFQSRHTYYLENYRSKPVGEKGWRERVEQWQLRPKPRRKSFFSPMNLYPGEV